MEAITWESIIVAVLAMPLVHYAYHYYTEMAAYAWHGARRFVRRTRRQERGLGWRLDDRIAMAWDEESAMTAALKTAHRIAETLELPQSNERRYDSGRIVTVVLEMLEERDRLLREYRPEA